ncbi:MAG: ribose 5-phosphate isomerase A [Archaeoglobus sp.]|nr:MAG: ribose 5-phosphate isomerase A [Archaeoglobus sp.]
MALNDKGCSDFHISPKLAAAKKASEIVEDGMVIGIGSGTTVELFIKELSKRISHEELELFGVPTSYQSMLLAIEAGIHLLDLLECSELDICIDGADEVDLKLNAIKGGGGALTREKIVAYASREVVFVVEERKVTKILKYPVPIEVLPFSTGYVLKTLSKVMRDYGSSSKPRLRHGTGKLGPVITDNGNFIVDCDFGDIENPKKLEKELSLIPGVVECGIFAGVADRIIVGGEGGNTYELSR